MNFRNSNIRKSVFGAAAVALALGFSAYTNAGEKSAPGDYRFYNKSQMINNPDLSQYVFRDDPELCDPSGEVCSELWNIGTQTAPIDGTELDSYTITPTLVTGEEQPGTYTGN